MLKEDFKKIIIAIVLIVCTIAVIAMLFISRAFRQQKRAEMREASEIYQTEVLPGVEDSLDLGISVGDEIDPGNLIFLCTDNKTQLLYDIKPMLDANGHPALVAVTSFDEGYLQPKELKKLYDSGWGVCLSDQVDESEATEKLTSAGIKLSGYTFYVSDRALYGDSAIPVGGSRESGCKNRVLSCIARGNFLAIGIGYGSDLDMFDAENISGMLSFLDKYFANNSLITTVLDE